MEDEWEALMTDLAGGERTWISALVPRERGFAVVMIGGSAAADEKTYLFQVAPTRARTLRVACQNYRVRMPAPNNGR